MRASQDFSSGEGLRPDSTGAVAAGFRFVGSFISPGGASALAGEISSITISYASRKPVRRQAGQPLAAAAREAKVAARFAGGKAARLLLIGYGGAGAHSTLFIQLLEELFRAHYLAVQSAGDKGVPLDDAF